MAFAWRRYDGTFTFTGGEATEASAMRTNRLRPSFLPIPALAAVIGVVHFAFAPDDVFEPPWLLPVLNTLFVTLVCFSVAYLAARNFRATGRLQVLLLGAGVLAFGTGGAVAGFLRQLPGSGANLNVTTYNTAAMLGGVCHFAAAWLLLRGAAPVAGRGRKHLWLILAYAGPTVFMGLLTLASFEGVVPAFFEQGVGPTALRQAVLGTADTLFAFSFVVLMGTYLRNREPFLYWYSSALALTSLSLSAFLLEGSVGSAVGWAGRLSQYLAGVYFLTAIATALRSAQARRTSLEDVLTAALSPAEEKFRALAEHSPDLIARFDVQLRHVYANPAALALYGRPARAVIGATAGQAGLPEAFASFWHPGIRRVFATGRPVELEGHLPGPGGMSFYQSHCVPEYGPDGTVANVLVVSRDLSGRRRAEEWIREQNAVLEGINRIFAEALVCESEEDLGKVCLEVAQTATGSPCGFVAELNPRAGRLDTIAVTPPEAAPGDPAAGGCAGLREAGGLPVRGLFGRVIRDGRPLLTNVPELHPDSVGTPAGHIQLSCFLGVPLSQHGAILGMVAVANRPGGYRQQDLHALESLAGPMVQALMRRRAEKAVRESEEHFRALAEALPQIVWTADAGGRVEWLNQRWEEFTGTPPRRGLGRRWYASVHRADVATTIARGRQARDASTFFQTELRLRRRDGTYRWFLVRAWPFLDRSGRVVRYFGTSTDVDELKRTQVALQQSSKRLELLADTAEALLHAQDPRAVVEPLCRNVMEHLDCQVFFNFLLVDRDGCSATTLQLNACAGVDPGQEEQIRHLDLDQAICGLVARTGQPMVVEHLHTAAGPEVARLASWGVRALACHALLAPGGRVVGTLAFGSRTRATFSGEELSLMKAVAEHVSVAIVRMHDERRLQELNASLETRVSERTAEVERLADQLRGLATELARTEQRERRRLAAVLHDHVQQLLVAAQIQLDLLERAEPAAGHTSVAGISSIVSEAIAASRSLAVELSPPILHQAGLGPALGWLARQLREHNRFTVHVDGDGDPGPADESMRALLFDSARELLLNAIKHSGVSEARVVLGHTSDGGTILTVEDDGRGFDPAEPPSRMGADGGLGLFSIQQRLAYLGGRLEIDSAPGRGAVITLLAPAEHNAAALEPTGSADTDATPYEAGPPGPRDRISVLLADDHEIVRQGLARLLESESDLEVVAEAATGREAVDLARIHRPDVVVMDVNMPVMDGIEATRIIVRELPAITVIALSMHVDAGLAEAMRAAGAHCYLSKGGPSDDLVSAIRSCAAVALTPATST